VLVAVLHPGDGFPGDRIEALRRTGLELLRTAGGDAEPLGDDGVAPVFDDAGVGLEGASRLHRQAAEDEKGDAWGGGRRRVRPADQAGQGELSSLPTAFSFGARLRLDGAEDRARRPESQRVAAFRRGPTGDLLGAGVPFTTLSYPGVGPVCATPVPAKTDTPSTTAAIEPAFSLVYAIGVRGFVRYTQD
jgi:hypothetical protein